MDKRKFLEYNNNNYLIWGSLGLFDFKIEESVWKRLKRETRPIILYGMGDGALKIMSVCRSHGIKISGIFASDEFVRGHSFEGFKVKKLSEIEEEFDDFVILLCFAAFLPDLLDKIYSIHKRHEVIAPDVPVFGDGLFDEEYFESHKDELLKVYSVLADETSKKVFQNVLNFKLSGKIDLLKEIETEKYEVFENVIKLSEGEHYLDLGGYDGDTVEEFLKVTGDSYASVTVLEPDPKNFRKLTNKASEKSWNDITLLNEGIWDSDTELSFDNRAGRNSYLSEKGKVIVKVRSIDSVLKGKDVTFIKMDVEGAELRAIMGAKETLKTKKPKLAFSGYHRNEDLFSLPLALKEIEPDYRIYLRHHPYLPAWETNFYAVAEGK